MITDNLNLTIIDAELDAMKQGKEDVRGSFRQSISKTNENGLAQAVWAYRSDYLEYRLREKSDCAVLHIKRSALWQIDPIVDKESGVIYIPMTAQNMELISKRCQKDHTAHHYSNSFNLLNGNLPVLPDVSVQQELVPLSDEEKAAEKERKERDLTKMLSANRELIKKAVFITVDYVAGKAIDAVVNVYNEEFVLSEMLDVSNRLFKNEAKETQKQMPTSAQKGAQLPASTRLQVKIKSDRIGENK